MKHMSTIHCDQCHTEFRGFVPDFHNKKCEKCGHSPLISDQDMEVYRATDMMVELGLATRDPSDPRGGLKVSIDTSVLRTSTKL